MKIRLILLGALMLGAFYLSLKTPVVMADGSDPLPACIVKKGGKIVCPPVQ